MKYLPLFLCLIFFACVEDSLDGSCTPPVLSKTKLYFNEQGGVDTIVVKKGSASLHSRYEGCELIKPDHYIWNISEGNEFEIIKVESEYCKNNYCPFQPRVTPDGMPYAIYDNSYNAPTVGIKCLWYSVVHIDEKSMVVSVKKNETGKERSLDVDLFAGDCGAGFTIIQSAGSE